MTAMTMKDPRAMRINQRRQFGFDDAGIERKINRGFPRQHWLHAEDLLPPIRSFAPDITAPADRDWEWLLEVWRDRPLGPDRDQMLAECRAHLSAEKYETILNRTE